MLNRLVYRKGIDLQAVIIPVLCRALPHLRVIIGGDGPKRSELEAMMVAHNLHNRVTLVGSVQHEAARDLLVSGAACCTCLLICCTLVCDEGRPAGTWVRGWPWVRLARISTETRS